MSWLSVASVAVAVAVAGPPARAQGMPPARGQELPPGGPRRPLEPRRDEAFKLVDAYVVSNLQESLGLSDEQFVKALPLVKKVQNERRDFMLERVRLQRELRRSLRSGGMGGEAQVIEQLNELKSLEAEGPARVRRAAEALDAVLTPMQQAKFRLLELEVEQRMRELMNRARRPGGGPLQREPD